jgi:Holliday junction DNA helicase RuvA
MIASIRGVVQRVGDDEIVLDVGGVGMLVGVPASVVAEATRIGKPMFLHTYMAVRDSAINLYGFNTPEERELFEVLLQVSGVGPRLALAVLSHLSPDVLRSAVVQDQPATFASVPGIGQKTAQKIIFHLKDRLEVPYSQVVAISEVDTEVLGVLTALGISLVEAQTALQSIPSESPEDVETRVKLALKYFASP